MIDLPPGKYFMVMWNIAQQFGGMTSMCMARARNFLEYAGVNAPVLSFSLTGRYKALEASLKERGHLHQENQILNVFEYYRDADLTGRTEVDAPDWRDRRPENNEYRHEQIIDQDGQVIADVYRDDDNAIVYRECYRPNASVYFVDHSEIDSDGVRTKRQVWLIDQTGRTVGSFAGAGQFYYRWMDELADGDRATFIFDDKSAATILRRYSRSNVLMITPIHSNHIKSAGDPDRGVFDPNRLQIFTESWRWDALVFLTDSQLRDYTSRFGNASNLSVIANPIDLPEPRTTLDRRNFRRGVIVGRLASSKRVTKAIEAFRLAREAVPDLSLDIYGDGDQRAVLEEIIETEGLQGAVQLHGHVTRAADEFSTAGYSLITSKFEGFALAALESVARGCPVISFDLRYGPPDLVGDDEAGFIVPTNDVRAMAERIVRLSNDHELAMRMGEVGRERAESFSSESITRRWAGLIVNLWQMRAREPRVNRIEASATGHRDSTGVVVNLTLEWERESDVPLEESDIDVRLRIVPELTGPAFTQELQITDLSPNSCQAITSLDLAAILLGADGTHNRHATVEVVGAVRRMPFRTDIMLPKRTRWDPVPIDGKLAITATQIEAL